MEPEWSVVAATLQRHWEDHYTGRLVDGSACSYLIGRLPAMMAARIAKKASENSSSSDKDSAAKSSTTSAMGLNAKASTKF